MNTEYLRLNIFEPERDKLEIIVQVLRTGGLVVLPTETVYGVGFDPDSEIAARKIKAVKETREKPYSLCIPDLSWIKSYQVEERSLSNLSVIEDLLPGPITFVLNIKNRGKIGFRIPLNKITQSAVEIFARPIALASANASDKIPASNAQEAFDYLLSKVDLIIDGGCSTLCVPSMVLDLTENPVKILREGPLFVNEEVRKRYNI
ncbi:MAG: L-threonylcarbamoyladenylate synthase [Candidatus Omnitrophica bacterium]|nr:L-threonylcarbamoyladenylate synthase [Candidatus Omnitrophota bacterium]